MTRVMHKITFAFLIIAGFSINAIAAGNQLGVLKEKKGLSCSEIYWAVDNKKTESMEVPLKSVLKIYFIKTKGFALVDKMVYPAMSIRVTSQENVEVLSAENALSNFKEKGLPFIFSKKLAATIGVDEPMKVGKAYNVAIKLWDLKGKGQIDYSTTFKVTEKKKREEVGVAKIDSQGLTLKYAILVKGKEKAKYDLFEVGDTVKLLCAGVGEFEKGEDGLCSIDMDLVVKDADEKIITEAKSLLGESGHIKLESPSTNLTARIDTAGYKPGKYVAIVTIYDKITSKKANNGAKIILSGFDFGDLFDDMPSEAVIQKRLNKSRSLGRRDVDFITTTLKAKEHYDIIGIHYNRDYKGIYKLVEYIRRFSDKPIWADDATSSPFLLSMGGYYFNPLYSQRDAKRLYKKVVDGDPIAVSWFRKEQAKLTTKKFVAAAGEGLKKVMMALTAIWKASPGVGGFHSNFYLTSMVDAKMNPLPVFYTLGLLVEKLDGYTSVQRVGLGDNSVFCYKFGVNSKAVYVLWYEDNKNQQPGQAEGTKQVGLWAGVGPVKVTSIITDLGQERPLTETKEVKDGIVSILATETPVILERVN